MCLVFHFHLLIKGTGPSTLLNAGYQGHTALATRFFSSPQAVVGVHGLQEKPTQALNLVQSHPTSSPRLSHSHTPRGSITLCSVQLSHCQGKLVAPKQEQMETRNVSNVQRQSFLSVSLNFQQQLDTQRPCAHLKSLSLFTHLL